MLRFSEETGQTVDTADGARVGTLRDLIVDLHADEPLVAGLVIGTGRGSTHVAGWDLVEEFAHSLVRLRPGAEVEALEPRGEVHLRGGELLIGRDVLDTQVVDTTGSRLARVGDVLLTRREDGRLQVGAVDVGFGAVVRRLGLRRIAGRLPEEAIAWDDLHLTSERGHRIQLATTKSAVHRLDGDELAALLTRLSVRRGSDVLGAVRPHAAGHALAASHPDLAGPLLSGLADETVDRALDELAPHHAERLRRIRRRPKQRVFTRHRRRRR